MLSALLIYAIFIFILLFGIKFRPLTKEADFFFSFNRLRGFFALDIVAGHVVRYESSLLYPIGKFMIISVAFFFFVSAYGMARSYDAKEDYLHGFLFSKFSYLLAIAVIAYLHSLIIKFLFTGSIEPKHIIRGFFTSTNWYIWELLFFYLLFFLIYRYILKYRVSIIGVLTLLFATGGFAIGLPQHYYSSAMAFPAGLLFYEHFNTVTRFLKTVWGKLSTIIMTIAGLYSLFLGEDSLLGMVYLRNLICLAFLLLLTYFISYFEVSNKILTYLGKYSTEIYLYQFVFLLLTERQLAYQVRIPVVVAFTFLSALVLHPLNIWVKKKLKNLMLL